MMKKIFLLFIPIFLISAISHDTLFSVVTKKEDALVNHRYTKFVIVDDATGLALGKNPMAYDAGKKMPVNYFTLDLPEGLVNTKRVFVLHNLIKSEGGDDYDWVLEDNSVENTIIFSRRKFVALKMAMHWRFIVRGERVLLKNIRTRDYLKITADGKFSPVDLESDASKWKFIHVF